MNTTQRVIKYVALAAAILLAISIIGGIVGGLFGLLRVLGAVDPAPDDSPAPQAPVSADFYEEFSGVRTLDLDLDIGAGDIVFVKGDVLSVSASGLSRRLSCTQAGDALRIDYDFHLSSLWDGDSRARITIALPEEPLSQITLSADAGNITADALSCDRLELELGAGNFTCGSLSADSADISGGAGNITVSGLSAGSLALDGGVGEIDLAGSVTRSLDVDAGVGNVHITLSGEADSYRYDIETGIGNVTLDGARVSGNLESGDKTLPKIEVDGGVGNVEIAFDAAA